MDTRMIEEFLEKRLRRLLGKQVLVSTGPHTINKYSGIRPEVFIHVSKLEDFNGMMPDGAHTARRPATGTTNFQGFEEERPGRITITATTLSNNYKLIQGIGNLLTPAILLSLELLPVVKLGSLPDDSVRLSFEDFTANLHSAENQEIAFDDALLFQSELTFYLNGFIHVWLTKKGGCRSKSTSMPKIKSRSRVVKRTGSTSRKRNKSG